MRSLLMLAALAVGGAGCVKQEQAETVATNKRPTKEEVEAAVIGQTPERVIEVMGRPSTSFGADNFEWKYTNYAIHPHTGKPETILVVFVGGKVKRVKFIGS